MAGHEASRILLCAGLLLTVGCASSRTPETVRSTQAPSPAQTPAPSAAPPARPEPAPAPAPAPQEVPPEAGDKTHVVVVEAGDEEDDPQTLVQAARAERERRATSTPPAVSITDKNLPEYARKGQITVVDPSKEKKGPAAAPAAPRAAPGEPVRDEQYWRNRGLDIRLRWRQAADDAKELEEKAASLRQKFYAEDDPYVRNNRIKPEWDRTLDRLRDARAEIETSKQELTEFLEEGRVAGVYPGWLREGFDMEPEDEEPREETPPAESIEPPIMEPPL